MTRTVILIAVVVLLIMAGVWLKTFLFGKSEPKITAEYITGKMEVASELNTAELTYTGIVRYEDGSIPWITQKGFTMKYTATVKAGIDFSKIKVDVNSKNVIVTLPETEIQSVNVDSNSIDFYDQSYAIFNWSDKQDVATALQAAESDVISNANLDELKAKSEEQTEKLIRGLLQDTIGDRELIIEKKAKQK
jgi:hypothetical protein